MNKYEIMFIVKATMENEMVKKSAENMKNIISENNGKVIDFKEMGERKLAYPIKKEINGYYFVMQVEADKDAIKELDRKASIYETIIRHLIIKLNEE